MGQKKTDVDHLFQALGDPTRRSILEILSDRPMSVSELARPLQITLAAVIQHIQILEGSQLVKTKKAGRIRLCELQSNGFDLLEKWINEHKSETAPRLNQTTRFEHEPDGEKGWTY